MKRRKRLQDGTFGELEKVFSDDTPEEKVEKLEESNAMLIYSMMLKDAEMEDLIQGQAELTYNLMAKGVL